MKINSTKQNNIKFGAYYSENFVNVARKVAKGSNSSSLENKLLEISNWGDSKTELISLTQLGKRASELVQKVKMIAKNSRLPQSLWEQTPVGTLLTSSEATPLDIIMNTTPELVNKLERQLMSDTVRDYKRASNFSESYLKDQGSDLRNINFKLGRYYTASNILASLKTNIKPSVYENFAKYTE